jgi:hypothetical protein
MRAVIFATTVVSCQTNVMHLTQFACGLCCPFLLAAPLLFIVLSAVKSNEQATKQWAHQGLNLEPPDYESGALTD